MVSIPVMEEVKLEEVRASGGYLISTKFVYCWKRRVEREGWFRRARLVARQFKTSVDMEQAFAPTPVLVIPKMLINLTLNVSRNFVAMTSDIKDAFLMAAQPEDEKAYVEVDGKAYKLIRCLPGQRTAASQWFQLFTGAAKESGVEQYIMQPTLLMIHKVIYITVHVDDVFMVGDEKAMKEFVDFLKMKKKWSIEEKGRFLMGERFSYLKRDFTLYRSWCDIRCDYKQYESLGKEMDLYRKTHMEQSFSKRDEGEELQGAEVTRYRSVVGRLMYLAGERPDAQFAIQARFMSRPTKQAWNKAWRVCSYLQGTEGYGVRLTARAKGQSVMNVKDSEEVEDKEQHLLEVVTDADYAGDRNDRRSTTSFQVFIDGNLMESRVRAQKAISLSSGESEFVAVVAGSSDGMLIKHLWEKITEEKCEMKVRSDSLAARAMVQRQGIGPVRRLDASLLWAQQKEKDKTLSIGPIPTELNCVDLGAKALTKKRMLGLLYMLKVAQHGGERERVSWRRGVQGARALRANEEGIEEGDEKQRPSHRAVADDGNHGSSRRKEYRELRELVMSATDMPAEYVAPEVLFFLLCSP